MEQAIKQLRNQQKQLDQQIEQQKQTLNSLISRREEVTKGIQALELLSGAIPEQQIHEATQPAATASESIKGNQETKTWKQIFDQEHELTQEEKIDTIVGQKKKAYVIFDGPWKGIYQDWHIVKSKVNAQPYKYKGYNSLEEAKLAYKQAYAEITKANEVKIEKSMKTFAKNNVAEKIRGLHKSEPKELTEAEFYRNWKMITEWKEESANLGFYPDCSKQVKAVFFIGADPHLLSSFYQSGLISYIYLQEDEGQKGAISRATSQLPKELRRTCQQYQLSFAKTREFYLAIQSSYPVFDEEKMLVPAKHLVKLGISASSYPENKIEKTNFNFNLFINSIDRLYNQIRQYGTTIKGFKVLMKTQLCLAVCLIRDQAEESSKIMVMEFELDISTLTGIFSHLPKELKNATCEKMHRYKSHLCESCEINFPELKEAMNVSNDENKSIKSVSSDEINLSAENDGYQHS
uniref:Transactivator/viroplasmin protein n=1 Tax=Soybean chlorotic mottle virus TaxID=10651 RepID=A0A4D6TZ18_SOCMV|nr:translation transactivator [Soybean chlorotic mottle virus]